ncbi:hypothetical protein SAMN05216271_3695 [Halopseudomonas sabulinigri]|uniref:ChrR-like cupin domain-containing protein n=1 Tax=Halopseudomonas sabulinigri TaxID=472181 RepID=A0A1H1XWG1_9GAMM|nr:regulator [Halopseudomonas sabulinigri]SDT13542.1 hypothetical protein SAMN05216271_3695 [Halopseudomonas sabulinigri]
MQHFDDRQIHWSQLPGFENFSYSILNIDQANQLVDVIFHFRAHDPIVLHRHCALNHTFVISGEHHLYHANGDLKEIRPTGSYTVSAADSTPHRECGGDGGTVVLFSIRGTSGVMYEILDDQQNLIAALGMAEFAALHEANQRQQAASG